MATNVKFTSVEVLAFTLTIEEKIGRLAQRLADAHARFKEAAKPGPAEDSRGKDRN